MSYAAPEAPRAIKKIPLPHHLTAVAVEPVHESLVAVITMDKYLRMFDLRSGAETWSFNLSQIQSRLWAALAFDPAGKTLIAIGAANGTKFWRFDAISGEPLSSGSLPGGLGSSGSNGFTSLPVVRLSSDQRMILSAWEKSGQISLASSEDGAIISAFNIRGQTSSGDDTAHSAPPIMLFKEHEYDVRFEQNDRFIKATYPDGIFIWDIVGNHLVSHLPMTDLALNQNEDEHICQTALSNDGRLFGLLTVDDYSYWGRFILVDAEVGKPLWSKQLYYRVQGCGNIQFDDISKNVFVTTWAPELFQFNVLSGDVISNVPLRSQYAGALFGFSQIVGGGCGLITSFGESNPDTDGKELNYWKLQCAATDHSLATPL